MGFLSRGLFCFVFSHRCLIVVILFFGGDGDVLLRWQPIRMKHIPKNSWRSIPLKDKTLNFFVHVNKLCTYLHCYKCHFTYQCFPTEREEIRRDKQATMWIHFCHLFCAETQSEIKVELCIHTFPKSEKQKLHIVPRPVFPLIFALGLCSLALVLGVASKCFQIFGCRSLTEMHALILMDMWAWKVDLSAKLDIVFMPFTGEAQDYEKGVYESLLFTNIYYSEHLFMSWYGMPNGQNLVLHSSIQSH